jgi:excisionase family DNA binding protein
MPSEPTRAVYVRMADRLARKLDSAAERLGVSKRELLAALVDDHLNAEEGNLADRLRNGRAARSPAGHASGGEVLTLEEAAELLRVEAGDVRALIDDGELPARRLGQQLRLSRTAVLAWLRGDELPGTTVDNRG